MDKAHQKGGGGEWARRDQPWAPLPAPSNLPGADLMAARPSNSQQESQANFPVIPTFAIRARIDAVASGRAALRQPDAADGAQKGLALRCLSLPSAAGLSSRKRVVQLLHAWSSEWW